MSARPGVPVASVVEFDASCHGGQCKPESKGHRLANSKKLQMMTVEEQQASA
jgi:hypothetical protein